MSESPRTRYVRLKTLAAKRLELYRKWQARARAARAAYIKRPTRANLKIYRKARKTRNRRLRLYRTARTDRNKAKRAYDKSRRRRSLGGKAWHAAGNDLGVRERGGNNAGPDVARIIRDGGGNPADRPPWCVYGVAHWFKVAGSTADWGVAWGAVRRMHKIPGVKIRSTGKFGHPVRFTFDHTALFGGYCNYLGKSVSRRRATHIRTREANTGASGAVSDSIVGGDGVHEKVRPIGLVADYLEVTK